MTDPILTLPEVAVLLKVAEKTVYTMARKGARYRLSRCAGNGGSNTTTLIAWIDDQKAAA